MDFSSFFLILQSMKSVNIWLTQKMFSENKNRCRQIKDRGLNKIQDTPIALIMFSCFRFAWLETITGFCSIAESAASGYLEQETGSVRDGQIRSRAHAPPDQRPPFSVPALHPDHKNREGGHYRLPGPWSLRLSVLCGNKAPRQASDVYGNLIVGKATYNKSCLCFIKFFQIRCSVTWIWIITCYSKKKSPR